MTTVMPAPGTADPPDGPTKTEEVKPPQGVILPPPDLRSKIDKTTAYVAARSANFIHQLTATPETAAKFPFALEDNPFYAYFRWRIQECREGRGSNGAAIGKSAGSTAANQGPPEPPKFNFSARMPNISAIDLDIIKTTAVFVAKHGRQWMIALSQRESQNPQFNFLRPTHTLHGFFTLLVDQYKDLMTGATVSGGEPQRQRIEGLKMNLASKSAIIEKAKLRAAWYKHREDKRVKEQADKEAEQRAYKEIDWDDFVVVGTIEFTQADDDVELPAPTSLSELQSASLEQKAAFSIPVDRRLEETRPDDPLFFGSQDTSSLPAAQVTANGPAPPQPQFSPPQQQMFFPGAPQQYPQYPQPYSPAPQFPHQQQQMPPPAFSPATQSPFPPPLASASPAPPPGSSESGHAPPAMRIRNDYVPRAQARRQNAPTVLCPICKEHILESEYAQHVKIEQLDPAWRTQNAAAMANRSGALAGANNAGADIARNLKRLSSQRQDGSAGAGGNGDADGARKRLEAQQGIPAGAPGTLGVPGTLGANGVNGANGPPGATGVGVGPGGHDPSRSMDVQEQIRALQSRYPKDTGTAPGT